MWRIFRAHTLIFMLILALAGLAPATESKLNLQTLVQDNTLFAIDLYKKLCTGTGNLSVSPYSISSILAMTCAGAVGNTRKQMARTLRFSLGQKSLDPAFESLQSTLSKIEGKNGVSLSIANAIWPQIGYGLAPKYLDETKRYYGISVTPLDYQNQPGDAAKTINSWVQEKTKDKIKDIIPVDGINAMTKMVLTNAICFKGDWEQKFEPDLTEKTPFFVTSANSVEIPMMEHTGTFNYGEMKSFQILEMPYVGNDLSMITILPRETEGLKALESDLSTENLKLWKNKMVPTNVLVHFPKFAITSGFDLSDILISMGMVDAFSSRDANFGGIAPQSNKPLYLSSVVQKAFLEVNEEGTEAAAATLIEVPDSISVRAPMLKVFQADHPFIFLIRENLTGTILFIGRVSEPIQVKKNDMEDNPPSSNQKNSARKGMSSRASEATRDLYS
ncbi:MAG: serpin family protein [Deltaproteobacteria bacterium]|nr:serpin family protein [Deltaproteobacteria bacterium]